MGVYHGVKSSYTLLALLLMEIIEDAGTDKGIEMLQSAIEVQADIVHRELVRQIPEGTTPLKIGDTVYRTFMEGAGAEVSVHEREEDSITYMVERCPFNEAFLDIGIDCGYFLQGLCTQLTLPAVQAILSKFDARLEVEARLVRETAEEFCLERVFFEGAKA
ncbi:MAG: hypothetical protein PVJ38_05545 [Candidatus Bathyarchaeota archaeon]|jgi:hypothetical protein